MMSRCKLPTSTCESKAVLAIPLFHKMDGLNFATTSGEPVLAGLFVWGHRGLPLKAAEDKCNPYLS